MTSPEFSQPQEGSGFSKESFFQPNDVPSGIETIPEGMQVVVIDTDSEEFYKKIVLPIWQESLVAQGLWSEEQWKLAEVRRREGEVAAYSARSPWTERRDLLKKLIAVSKEEDTGKRSEIFQSISEKQQDIAARVLGRVDRVMQEVRIDIDTHQLTPEKQERILLESAEHLHQVKNILHFKKTYSQYAELLQQAGYPQEDVKVLMGKILLSLGTTVALNYGTTVLTGMSGFGNWDMMHVSQYPHLAQVGIALGVHILVIILSKGVEKANQKLAEETNWNPDVHSLVPYLIAKAVHPDDPVARKRALATGYWTPKAIEETLYFSGDLLNPASILTGHVLTAGVLGIRIVVQNEIARQAEKKKRSEKDI